MFHQLPKQEVPDKIKKDSINFILKETKLAPQTFTQFVVQFYKDFGIRFIFEGIEDVLIIICLLSLPLFFNLNILVDFNARSGSFFWAFVISPLTFGLLYFLSIWKEILVGTFELKQTLRISLRELMMMRILAFSVVALLVSVVGNVILWLSLEKSISLFQLLSVSFVSLAIFTAGQLLLEFKLSMKSSYFVGPLIWFSLSSVLFVFHEQVDRFLLKLPIIVTVGLLILALMGCFYLMQRNYAKKKEGGLVYART